MVQQYQTKDNSVTVYLNNFAHIATSVQLKVENGIAQIVGIAPEFMPETLHTILDSKGVEIKRARILEPTTLAEIADSKIGSEKEVSDIKGGLQVTPLAVQDDKLLVKSGTKGIYSKPLNAFYYPETENLDIRQRQALELQLGGLQDGEERTLNMSYLTGGIILTPHYNIVLGEGKLVLNANVEVDNRTKKSYEGVELAVIPGDVGKPYLPRRESPRIRRFAVAAAEMVLEEAVTRFEEEGQIGYAFGKKDLPKGDSRFSIFSTERLDYQIVYRTDLGYGKAKIDTVLKFKAPTTLQKGSVGVYGEKLGIDEKSKIERYEGGGAISPVLKDKDVDIALRTPDTLEMKVEQIGETEIVRTDIKTEEGESVFALKKEYKVTAKNTGKDDVTIETYLGLSGTESFLESSLEQHEESRRRKVRWDIDMKAGVEVSFTYKTQNIQFTRLPEHIIRQKLGRE